MENIEKKPLRGNAQVEGVILWFDIAADYNRAEKMKVKVFLQIILQPEI